jgi:pyruvate dehydrogenase E2 component (dihydrolipoamide acetyltransferase)
MAAEIRIPRLGWSMEEGTFVGWLKRHGDRVEVGEALYELEGEKASQEIESVDAGFLHIAESCPKPGTLIPVGHLLGYLLAEGEPVPSEGDASPAIPSSLSKPEASPATDPKSKDAELRQATSTSIKAIRITPRAKKLASQYGIVWADVEGSGRNGRIREIDIRQLIDSGRTSAAAANRLVPGLQRTILSGRRLAIANRMMLSKQKTVPVTLHTKVEVGALVAKRAEWKSTLGSELAPSYSDCIAYLAARLLVDHPNMAAIWENDTSLLLPDHSPISIGIAVDTPDGLLVPVVSGASQLSFGEFVSKSKDVIARCRSGRVSHNELAGGQFSVTSLGAYGIDSFTPIINYPEVAILGLGAIRTANHITNDGSIEVRHEMGISLTFDHRAMDGVPPAAFVQALAKSIERDGGSLDVKAR